MKNILIILSIIVIVFSCITITKKEFNMTYTIPEGWYGIETSRDGNTIAVIDSDNGGIIASINGGDSWLNITQPEFTEGVFDDVTKVVAANNNYLGCFSNYGGYATYDFGTKAWTIIESFPNKGSLFFYGINSDYSEDAEYIIVAYTDVYYGVYRLNSWVVYISSDYGETWSTSTIAQLPSEIQIDGVAVNQSGDIMMITTHTGYGYGVGNPAGYEYIYASYDYGVTWSEVQGGLQIFPASVGFVPNNSLHVAAISDEGNMIGLESTGAWGLYSDDGGDTWTQKGTQDGQGTEWRGAADISSDGTTIVIAESWRVAVSSNFGDTWTVVFPINDNDGDGLPGWDGIALKGTSNTEFYITNYNDWDSYFPVGVLAPLSHTDDLGTTWDYICIYCSFLTGAIKSISGVLFENINKVGGILTTNLYKISGEEN